MRQAGLFSHLVLAFVCASMTFVAFESTSIPIENRTALTRAETTAAADPVPAAPSVPVHPPSPAAALDHWTSAARTLEHEVSPPSVSATTAAPAPVVLTPAPPVAIAAPEPPAPALAPAPSAPVVVATAPPTAPVQAADPAAPISAPAAVAMATPTAAAVSPDSPADTGGTPGLKPAKVLFGAVATPAPLAARAIGTYAKGCLSGGQALPVDGPTWQAMRLSRNRNWGHPKLVKLIEKLSADGKEKDGWPGLLVGDLAQPRGGPMITGHASHQIGLDADLWLTPMPDRRLTSSERETIEATSMLSEDGTTVNRDVWTEQHFAILKRAASYPEVERIFIHPAIKQVLCYAAKDDRSWLSKVRPYWGHHYHFHVRMNCPAGSANCEPQKSVPGDDGCGKELDDWLKLIANIKTEPAPLPIPAPPVVTAKPKEKPPMTLDQLPHECSVVLATGNPDLARDIAAAAKAAEVAKALKILKANEKAAVAPAVAAQSKTPTVPVTAPVPAAASKPHASEKKTITQ